MTDPRDEPTRVGQPIDEPTQVAPVGGGPPTWVEPGPAGGPPPPPDRRPWIVAGLLAVIAALLLVLLLTRDDDDDGDDDATASTTTELSTSTSEATTTSTTEAPTTTEGEDGPLDVDDCEAAGANPATPGLAAETVFEAWTLGDVECANVLMTDDALLELFERDGEGATDEFQGCTEEADPEPQADCAFTYEGGSTHYVMSYSALDGWQVFDVEQIAD
jgi:hypothetical protein